VSAASVLGGLLIVGVVAAGGLYAGDRYAESRAEEYAGTVVSQNIPTTAAPTVDIKGFPFLTQLLTGTLDEVTATAPGATLDGISVTDVSVDATAVDIRPPAGQQGAPGTPGPLAGVPRAGGKPAEDEEHRVADYLEADPELFAAEQPVVPPTLGDWKKNKNWRKQP